jgi:transcriptional regulator
VRENPYYELTDEAEIRRLIRENPCATLVSNPSTGLVASHYPILLEEDRAELSIVTHVGRPDEKVHELGKHELLVIVQGPHGYISSSWYGAHIEVPTWNFIVAHLSGVPELLDPTENFKVLSRLVDQFERHVQNPRPLDARPEVAADARRDSRGTVGLRLVPTRIVAKRKMSQNKSPEIVETVLGELEGNGPYANESLAREMRLVHDADVAPD